MKLEVRAAAEATVHDGLLEDDAADTAPAREPARRRSKCVANVGSLGCAESPSWWVGVISGANEGFAMNDDALER